MSAILYIEDHQDTRLGVCRLLSRWGHTVWDASTMTAGLKLAETCGFDAVLSDIGLPDGNGYQLIRALRRRWPNVPAVAFTAWCSEQDRKDALDAGFNQHLCKPVDIESLRAALSPEQATHSSPAV